jgi:hypothetical protein
MAHQLQVTGSASLAFMGGSGNVITGADNLGDLFKVTIGSNLTLSGGVLSATGGGTGSVTSVAITESGDSLVITGSPITTAGTINIGFAGTGAQYIKGDGTLATFPTTIDQARKLVTEVYNSTGATLTKGTVVYINGGQGNLPTVTKAIATGDSTSAQTYGVVQADITNMNNGYVVVFGSLNDIDTSAYAVGTQLYLSGTTAGAWTSTKPYAPIHLVYVGIVVRSHPTQGVVEIRIQNGYELDELHDVQITSLADGDILKYDLATDLWKNVAGTTTNIAEGTNLYFTNARARAVLSTNVGSALTYNSSTGRFTLVAAESGVDGYLTGVDWAYFDSKQASLGTGTTSQFLRGDLVWATPPTPALEDLTDVGIVTPTNGQVLTYRLGTWKNETPAAAPVLSVFGRTGIIVATSGDYNTDLVTEGTTNLYYTNARARGSVSVDVGSALTYNSTTGRFSLPAADGTVAGYVTAADYNYWDAKQESLGTGTTAQYLRGDLTWSTPPAPALDDLTDVIITSPSNSQLLRYQAGNWINFTPTYISLTALSATAPLSYNNTTGVFSIAQATTSANGYLSSTDWNTFNNKQPLITAGTTSQYYRGDKTFQTLNTTAVTEGTNLYFTTARVLATALTGYTVGTNTALAATDTILGAFGKVQAQINSKGSGTVTSVAALTLGTTGTDLSSTVANGTTTPVITLNVPTASATNRGALSSTDWSTFNGKQNAITLTTTGTSGAATFVGTTLNIPQYQAAGTYVTSVTATSPLSSSGGITPDISISQATTSTNGYLSSTDWNTFNNKQDALTNPVTGSGASNYIAKWNTASSITNSLIYDNGTQVGINTTNMASLFDVTKNALGTTVVDTSGITLKNETEAISGSQQISPALHFESRGWGTGAATSQSTDWIMYNLPVQGTSPSNNLIFASAVNGAAYTTRATLTSAGALTITGGLSATTGTFSSTISAVTTATLTRTALTTTSTDGVIVQNTTAALVGTQVQMSPRIRLSGTAWNTGTSASNSLNWVIQNLPAAGNPPTSTLQFAYYDTVNATVTNKFTLTNAGNGVFSGTLSASNLSGTNTGDQTLSGLGGVPTSRTLTINGTSYDLSADRSWTISTGVTGSGTTNYIPKFTSASAIGNSQIYDSGTGIGIGTSTVTEGTQAAGSISIIPVSSVSSAPLIQFPSNGRIRPAATSDRLSIDGNPLYLNSTFAANVIMASGGGNVLIGTTTDAGVKLQVNGASNLVRLTSSSALSSGYADAFQMLFANQTGGGVSLNIGKSESTKNLAKMVFNYVASGSNSNRLGFGFYDADSLLNVMASGNVGINTSSPNHKLHTVGGGIGSGWSSLFENNSKVSTYISHADGYGMAIDSASNTSGVYVFKAAGGDGTNRGTNIIFQVNGDGKVGIGTSSPGVILEVARNNGGSTGGQLALRNSSASTLNSTTEISFLNDTGASGTGTRNGRIISQMENTGNGASNMQFWTWSGSTDAERMRITSGGNVLIGTTTDNGSKLQVNGALRVEGGAGINVFSGGGTGPFTVDYPGVAGGRFNLDNNGALTIRSSMTATAFFESSDKRLKKELNANPIVKGIGEVKPKLYIKDGKEELGYYAQDLKEVLPSAVSKNKDGFLSLSYAQVHTAKIAELENKIEQLEKLIKTLI